ncbi:MAG TPA: diacylglycerol kinase family protein [Acidimicrobiia bacterium]|nr:diacylglycerol kinase family protein [Acidimicrobiia bacterium]
MRVLLIVNLTASSVTVRRRVEIQRILNADHKLEVVETSRRGHAARLARSAALDGVDVVAVLAGDGTLNEAADGLAGTVTALAPLPGGSTNVFARTIGVAYDPVEATHRLVASLRALKFRRIGLGSASGRRFMFHLGLGFDAAVIGQVERRSFLKRHLAHPLYVAAAVETWFRHYDRSRPRFRVTVPDGRGGEEEVGDSAFAIVSNTSPYTYLGRLPIVANPAAGLEDPLALTMFRTLEIPLILRSAASALTTTRMITRNPKIAQRDGLEALTITGHGPFPFQVDGDYLGETERLDIRYEPDALTLVMP